MSLLNLKTNGIYKMEDIEIMIKDKKTLEEVKICTELEEK